MLYRKGYILSVSENQDEDEDCPIIGNGIFVYCLPPMASRNREFLGEVHCARRCIFLRHDRPLNVMRDGSDVPHPTLFKFAVGPRNDLTKVARSMSTSPLTYVRQDATVDMSRAEAMSEYSVYAKSGMHIANMRVETTPLRHAPLCTVQTIHIQRSILWNPSDDLFVFNGMMTPSIPSSYHSSSSSSEHHIRRRESDEEYMGIPDWRFESFVKNDDFPFATSICFTPECSQKGGGERSVLTMACYVWEDETGSKGALGSIFDRVSGDRKYSCVWHGSDRSLRFNIVSCTVFGSPARVGGDHDGPLSVSNHVSVLRLRAHQTLSSILGLPEYLSQRMVILSRSIPGVVVNDETAEQSWARKNLDKVMIKHDREWEKHWRKLNIDVIQGSHKFKHAQDCNRLFSALRYAAYNIHCTWNEGGPHVISLLINGHSLQQQQVVEKNRIRPAYSTSLFGNTSKSIPMMTTERDKGCKKKEDEEGVDHHILRSTKTYWALPFLSTCTPQIVPSMLESLMDELDKSLMRVHGNADLSLATRQVSRNLKEIAERAAIMCRSVWYHWKVSGQGSTDWLRTQGFDMMSRCLDVIQTLHFQVEDETERGYAQSMHSSVIIRHELGREEESEEDEGWRYVFRLRACSRAVSYTIQASRALALDEGDAVRSTRGRMLEDFREALKRARQSYFPPDLLSTPLLKNTDGSCSTWKGEEMKQLKQTFNDPHFWQELTESWTDAVDRDEIDEKIRLAHLASRVFKEFNECTSNRAAHGDGIEDTKTSDLDVVSSVLKQVWLAKLEAELDRRGGRSSMVAVAEDSRMDRAMVAFWKMHEVLSGARGEKGIDDYKDNDDEEEDDQDSTSSFDYSGTVIKNLTFGESGVPRSSSLRHVINDPLASVFFISAFLSIVCDFRVSTGVSLQGLPFLYGLDREEPVRAGGTRSLPSWIDRIHFRLTGDRRGMVQMIKKRILHVNG